MDEDRIEAGFKPRVPTLPCSVPLCSEGLPFLQTSGVGGEDQWRKGGTGEWKPFIIQVTGKQAYITARLRTIANSKKDGSDDD
jgi:hypothetical protein